MKKPLKFHSGAVALLVGRAKFELATNGLKDVRIVINGCQNINLSLPEIVRGIGGWSSGLDWLEAEVGWIWHWLVG
jgi:hypothetical protein